VAVHSWLAISHNIVPINAFLIIFYITGEDGYIRLKRVDPSTLDDPTSDCKLDDKPGDGVACEKDGNGNDVTPNAVLVCGTSAILFDGVVPIGGHLL
jgi:hypothetical protein